MALLVRLFLCSLAEPDAVSDTHMKLEARLAKFFGAEEGIIYSSGYATMPAMIPTFSGRGDLIVA